LLSFISYALTDLSAYACWNPVSALPATHLRLFLLFRKPVYGSHGDGLTEAQFHQFSFPLTKKVGSQLFFLSVEAYYHSKYFRIFTTQNKIQTKPTKSGVAYVFYTIFFSASVTSRLRYTKPTFTSMRLPTPVTVTQYYLSNVFASSSKLSQGPLKPENLTMSVVILLWKAISG